MPSPLPRAERVIDAVQVLPALRRRQLHRLLLAASHERAPDLFRREQPQQLLLGSFRGSATESQCRKCDLTVVVSDYDQRSMQGCATRLWNPKNTFWKLTLYHGPLISSRFSFTSLWRLATSSAASCSRAPAVADGPTAATAAAAAGVAPPAYFTCYDHVHYHYYH